MTRETNPTTSHISTFNVSNGIIQYPEFNVLVSELDEQIRDWKQMVWNSLKNMTGEVSASHTALSSVKNQGQNLTIVTRGKTSVGLAIALGDGNTTTFNTYTLTTGETVTLSDGNRFLFQIDEGSFAVFGSTPKLVVDSNSAFNIVYMDGSNLQTLDLKADQIIEVIYDESESHFKIIGGLDLFTAFNNVVVFDTPSSGTDSWTVPSVEGYPSTYNVHIRAIGGGGSGGAGGANPGGCGGGGGGGYVEATHSLAVGRQVDVNVSAGGIAIAGSSGVAGSPNVSNWRLRSPDTSFYSASSGGGGKNTSDGRSGGGGGSAGNFGTREDIHYWAGPGAFGAGGDNRPSGGGGGGAGGHGYPKNPGAGGGGDINEGGRGGKGAGRTPGGSTSGGDGDDGNTSNGFLEGGGGGGGNSGTGDGGNGGFPGGGGGGATVDGTFGGSGGAGILVIYY